MNNIFFQYYKSPFGEMILGEYDSALCIADWRFRKARTTVDNRLEKFFDTKFVEKETDFLKKVRLQLESYFKGESKEFDLALSLAGTDFQIKVWQKLMAIPYGTTTTYLKLSEQLGDVKAIRAVANANGANAISIIVPCHRIIGSDNSMIGYAGGVAAKEGLLSLENPSFMQKKSLQISLEL